MPSTDPADNGHGDPFPDRPPQYVRALLYEYRFRPGNIRADRAVVGAPVGGALFPAGQPGRLPSSRAARNWAASRDRRKSLTLTARRQLRRRFAGVRRGMLNRHRSWGCRSELCLEMSHLNEDPWIARRRRGMAPWPQSTVAHHFSDSASTVAGGYVVYRRGGLRRAQRLVPATRMT